MSRAPRMRWRSEIRFPYLKETIVRLITLLVLWVTGALIQVSVAADLQLAWDVVSDSRVAYYELHQGTATQTYVNKVTTTGTTAAVTGLSAGQTYYFAARRDRPGPHEALLSCEVSTTIPGTRLLSITIIAQRHGAQPTCDLGGDRRALALQLVDGGSASGLTLNSATGAISGRPAVNVNLHSSGTIPVPRQRPAGHWATRSAARPRRLLSITTASLPNGTAGAAYARPCGDHRGNSGYSWSVTGCPVFWS
jgi:hypothetical protein